MRAPCQSLSQSHRSFHYNDSTSLFYYQLCSLTGHVGLLHIRVSGSQKFPEGPCRELLHCILLWRVRIYLDVSSGESQPHRWRMWLNPGMLGKRRNAEAEHLVTRESLTPILWDSNYWWIIAYMTLMLQLLKAEQMRFTLLGVKFLSGIMNVPS